MKRLESYLEFLKEELLLIKDQPYGKEHSDLELMICFVEENIKKLN